MKCEYIFYSNNLFPNFCGEPHNYVCNEEALPGVNYCILHIDLPKDESSEEFEKLSSSKDKKVKEKVSKRDFNFKGAKLSMVDISGGDLNLEIDGDLDFTDANVIGDATFSSITIKGHAKFTAVEIGRSVSFTHVDIDKRACFTNAAIGLDVIFKKVTIRKHICCAGAKIGASLLLQDVKIHHHVWLESAEINSGIEAWQVAIGGIILSTEIKSAEILFDNAKIGDKQNVSKSSVSFGRAIIDRDFSFNGATISGNVYVDGAAIGRDVSFDRAAISGGWSSNVTEIKGKLSFKETKFENPKAQEEACRKAKQNCEQRGDREEADYYHYREMDAKRKQKPWTIRLTELFLLQYVIGYWVKPLRVLKAFALSIIIFGALFWLTVGKLTPEAFPSSLQFSFLTHLNPISSIQNAQMSTIYGGLTIIAGFVGIFMWPVFIASLAKKYGR